MQLDMLAYMEKLPHVSQACRLTHALFHRGLDLTHANNEGEKRLATPMVIRPNAQGRDRRGHNPGLHQALGEGIERQLRRKGDIPKARD